MDAMNTKPTKAMTNQNPMEMAQRMTAMCADMMANCCMCLEMMREAMGSPPNPEQWEAKGERPKS